ncbi:TetR family transcriptional regulator [Roseobacter cerasinus]|uniref:TetR family transcriptional regulator n=1 Tax=Roseobacter cerasinus TaxID=2602289 RepID=A0A640VYR9_9RHOB|nr:TetR/AcrR family transcriptional regulator [Roseobacter cerasinus]GFE52105.1 TetR family transcriptional regulator [Roseobacter cerasinus]
MARTIAKDHDEKRERILGVAARVFAEEGFARASMSQIAKDCGISKANIYHYYSSKDALLFDILDTYLCKLRDRLAAVASEGQTPEEHLFNFLRETLLAYQGMDNEHKIQTEGVPLLPLDQQTILKGYQREMVKQLNDIIQHISPEAFTSDKAKLRAVTMSVFGMVNWFYMWNHGADEAERADYARMVAKLTTDGVRGL